ncbi:MAG: hypothetical protein AAGA93_15930 [Actinomycetota bacterium]
MVRWSTLVPWRRRRPSRGELIDRKHALEHEIRSLAADVRRRRSRNEPVADAEARLAGLRSRQYQIRLAIDRAEPEIDS